MKTTALAPWYGSNRMLAENVALKLHGCHWVGIPFAGGMSELVHIKARTIIANDLHLEVINLARVVSDPKLGPLLVRNLRKLPFHSAVLDIQQRFLLTYPPPPGNGSDQQKLAHAEAYFYCVWCARNGTAGTPGELRGGLSVRWKAGGGDSAVRYRSATESLREWQAIMRRCTFTTLDGFAFLDKCIDAPDSGIYCDPPFPGPGDQYTHKFTDRQHHQLAQRLAQFEKAKVVCRFYDVPLIRDLYPDSHWAWFHLVGRKSTNAEAPEVLIVNRKAAA